MFIIIVILLKYFPPPPPYCYSLLSLTPFYVYNEYKQVCNVLAGYWLNLAGAFIG